MNFKTRFKLKYHANDNPYTSQPIEGLEKALVYVKGKQVLDLGVGSGRNTELLINKGFKVTGVDSSPDALRILNNKIDSPNLTLINDDLLEYQFNKKFDLILSIGVLHFLSPKNSQELLKKIQNHTKIGGINFVVVKMSQNRAGDLPNVFAHKQLKNIYQKAGWEIIEYEEISSSIKKIAKIIAKKR
jgi:tellurite methyltransferase